MQCGLLSLSCSKQHHSTALLTNEVLPIHGAKPLIAFGSHASSDSSLMWKWSSSGSLFTALCKRQSFPIPDMHTAKTSPIFWGQVCTASCLLPLDNFLRALVRYQAERPSGQQS